MAVVVGFDGHDEIKAGIQAGEDGGCAAPCSGERAAAMDAGEGPDARFMRRALELAARGVGRTNPNPLVGAVIVRDGRVIGEGWHACYGREHAERAALADCKRRGEDPCGATVYVTLEPCAHQGKQPPCADALVEAGVARVVVGSHDPNPLVSGRGVARLREAGIEVACDVLRDECDAINQVFFHYITTRTPYVVAKWAMTADGRIACRSGDARWVSGPESREDAHALRNRLAAVMVGAGTVLADDPLLTCRLEGGHNPLRVVCDTELSLGLDSALVRSAAAGEAPLLVACAAREAACEAEGAPAAGLACGNEGEGSSVAARSDGNGGAVAREPRDAAADCSCLRDEKVARLRSMGIEVLELPHDAAGRVALPALMEALGARGIDSVLLEGGAHLHGSAFAAGIVNEAVAYVAPKLLGDPLAPAPVAGLAPQRMADALHLGRPHLDVLGEDVRLCWRVGRDEAVGRLPCVATGPLYPGGMTTRELAKARARTAKAGE